MTFFNTSIFMLLCFFCQAHPHRIELLMAVVEYKTLLVEPRRGVCSTWLANIDSSSGNNSTECHLPKSCHTVV